MRPLHLPEGPLSVLAVGAHCDDVEIGAGGLLLRLAAERPDLRVHVLVLTGTPERAAEARASAAAFLHPVSPSVEVVGLDDGRLPAHWTAVKDALARTARGPGADLVLAPDPHDAHQDHRLLGELVPTALRDHLVLHYEIPKWDGDLGAGTPGTYVTLDETIMARKWQLLDEHFVSQRGHDWFTEETFRALARLRGMECRAPYAEAFAVRKAVLSVGSAE